jgi:hypothetical protein
MFYYMLFVANPEFAAEQVRLSKRGGLSDADEIIAGKLREKGIVTTVAGLKDALKAGGVSFHHAPKASLVHSVTEMLAQLSEAGLDESAGGSSGGAGGGSSNQSATVLRAPTPFSGKREKRMHEEGGRRR